MEALLKENDMSKFVRFGNVIVNTDSINCIMDNGGKREIMLQHLSLVTDETFGDLLKMLNEKEPSNGWIPISERLPKEKQNVLLALKHNMAVGFWEDIFENGSVEWYVNTGDGFYTGTEGVDNDGTPIAWMPLPDPYGGEQNE